MEAGTPKIADFGLAGVVAPFNGSGFKLQCGTPEFTAPEIVGGAEYEGTAVDLWSVGVMLYEALSGQLPFHGASQHALFRWGDGRCAAVSVDNDVWEQCTSQRARKLPHSVLVLAASCQQSLQPAMCWQGACHQGAFRGEARVVLHNEPLNFNAIHKS
jgi:serine/threonine protein kinase